MKTHVTLFALAVATFSAFATDIAGTWKAEFNTQRGLQKYSFTLKQDIYKAYNDAATSIQQFYAGTKSVQTAEKAYNFAQKRYDLGLLTTIDLLTNQNNLNRARVELTQAHVDYVFKLKLLEFYKGQGLILQ